jgi:hypothetical protein
VIGSWSSWRVQGPASGIEELQMSKRRLGLDLVTIRIFAVVFFLVALAFGIWATVTGNSALFGRLTALAGVFSLVLAAAIPAWSMIIWTVRRRNSPLDVEVQQVPQQVDARREARINTSEVEAGGDAYKAGRDLITTNTTTTQIVGAPTVPLPRPELLPRDDKDFIGRENEIIRLTSLAASGASKVAVICGAPGIGKTSLARRAAHQLRDEADFPGGYLYADMLGYTTRRTPLAPGEVLGAFLRRWTMSGRSRKSNCCCPAPASPWFSSPAAQSYLASVWTRASPCVFSPIRRPTAC